MDTYFVVIDFRGNYKRFVIDVDSNYRTKDMVMQLVYNYVINTNKDCAIGIKNSNNFEYIDIGYHEINRELLEEKLNCLEDNFNSKEKSTDDVYFAKSYFFKSKKLQDTVIYLYYPYCTKCNDFSIDLFDIELFMLLNNIKKLKNDLNVLFENIEFLLKKTH